MAGPDQGTKKPEPAKPASRADRDKVATQPLAQAAPRPEARKPVQVVYFPKRGKPPPRRPTVSITELRAVGRDDDATDPNVVVTPEPKTVENPVPGAKPQKRTKSGEAPLPESHVAHV